MTGVRNVTRIYYKVWQVLQNVAIDFLCNYFLTISIKKDPTSTLICLKEKNNI